MNGDERDLNTLYVLTMYRYGDRERHSYVMGVFDTRGEADRVGHEEKLYRGGKYEPEVQAVIKNKAIVSFEAPNDTGWNGGDGDHCHDGRIL